MLYTMVIIKIWFENYARFCISFACALQHKTICVNIEIYAPIESPSQADSKNIFFVILLSESDEKKI